MGYVSYTHVERLGHPNVDGLLIGTCHVFPKLDGTNAVIWADISTGELCTGSRKRDMSSIDADDNHGFRAAMRAKSFNGELDWLAGTYDGVQCPIFYGEWLVPHSLRTYREDAWRQLYIFDARCPETFRYIHYDKWAPLVRSMGANVIEPLQIICDPTEADINHVRDRSNTYLIEDGEGLGEGVVVKNYGFTNKFGKTVWGKAVRNDFKEKNLREMGSPERNGTKQWEKEIAEMYVTKAFVDKTRANVESAVTEGVSTKGPEVARAACEAKRHVIIPRLLSTVYHELIDEETASFVKKFKEPTINFKTLRQFTIAQVKKHAEDLF
jgi:hypothetical protein